MLNKFWSTFNIRQNVILKEMNEKLFRHYFMETFALALIKFTVTLGYNIASKIFIYLHLNLFNPNWFRFGPIKSFALQNILFFSST